MKPAKLKMKLMNFLDEPRLKSDIVRHMNFKKQADFNNHIRIIKQTHHVSKEYDSVKCEFIYKIDGVK